MKFFEAFLVGFGITLGQYTYVKTMQALKKRLDKPIKLE